MASQSHNKGPIARSFYRDLDVTGEIRVLTLRAGEKGSPITCSLQHQQLSQNPKYEALPYMWGPEYPTHTIEVNGSECEVRENLWQALYHLRDEREDRTLWIDAVCINQGNTRERNHQVSLMGTIYSKARRVVVWPGMSDRSSTSAIRVLKLLAEERGTSDSGSSSFFKSTIFDGDALADLSSFCGRQYWSRLWIIQEVILGADVQVQCGDDSFDWSVWDYFSIS